MDPTLVAMRTKQLPREDNSTKDINVQVSYKVAKCCPPAEAGCGILLLKICLNNLPIRQFRDKKIVVVGRTFAI